MNANKWNTGILRGSRGGGGGGQGSEKSQKYRFSSHTGPDPKNNYKAIKPAFNVWPSSARQRNAI